MSTNESRRPQINPPPGRKNEGVDYLRECAFAVEPSLISLVEMASQAGWRKKEILLAIMIAAGDYFQNSGLEFDPEEISFIGPTPTDTLN
jgi:hypothetical protein